MKPDRIVGLVPEGHPDGADRDDGHPRPGYDSVHADDERGAFGAVMHLIRRGNRRVAIIQGPTGAGGKRNEGYLRALEAAGIPFAPELVVTDEWTRVGGASAALHLLRLPQPPSASSAPTT